MVNLAVKVGNLTLKNPFIAASGTYGFGREAAEFLDLSVWVHQFKGHYTTTPGRQYATSSG